LGQILATTHNIAFYKGLAEKAREAILEDRFLEFKKDFFTHYKRDQNDDGDDSED
jgi:queuine tRNA-ribosyltransferase